jgi:predicted nucleotidyltransferase
VNLKFGLTEKAIALIANVFKKFPEVTQVKIFGSRAMGNYRQNSDIDLVLFGEISNKALGEIAHQLDMLPLPYIFDIKCYNDITHEGLIEHIEKFGKDFL